MDTVKTDVENSSKPVFNRRFIVLTRAQLGFLIFHHLLGVVFKHSPSNLAPRQRSETGKAAFEMSLKIMTKVLQSFC